MKKLYPLTIVIFIALILIALYIVNHEGISSTDSFSFSKPDTKPYLSQTSLESDENSTRVTRNRPIASGNNSKEDEIDNLKRELKTAKAELEILASPLNEDMLSATVNAEIIPGDTLVTGGYKTADGNYEMTFLTPRSVTLSDGSEGIEIKSQVLSVGSEFVDKSGLGSLATNAGNTLQHGESWKQDDVKTTLKSASQAAGAKMLSSPGIIASPSSPFEIVIGEAGGSQFSISGTVEKNDNGNFSIKSRVERRPIAEPDAVPNP